MMRWQYFIGVVMSAWFSLAIASIETYPFDTPQQEAIYTELMSELRCVVCQNQNLADSNAKLAKDLRAQIHGMLVTQQASKTQVVDYMVARYGDFVLYKPPFASQTLLLWFGPFLFLGLGGWMAVRMLRKQSVVMQDGMR